MGAGAGNIKPAPVAVLGKVGGGYLAGESARPPLFSTSAGVDAAGMFGQRGARRRSAAVRRLVESATPVADAAW